MSGDDQIGTHSLAFLSANRAPGKRQIRVVNREELATSLVGLVGGLIDNEEDDEDFCDEHDDDGDSSGEDGSSTDGSEDSDESSSSDGSTSGSGNNKKKDTALLEKRSGSGDEDDGEDNSNSNSVGITDSMDAPISGTTSPPEVQQDLERTERIEPPVSNTPICRLCLNYNNDNEVIQCDSCGLTVHEGCYGVAEDYSESSEGSSETTEPWFCEPCLAGVNCNELNCELCPNKGGVLKKTDYGGGWVHLLCALYTTGCSFGDLDRLSPICLFDIGYNRFGMKSCVGCQKEGNRLASRMGVCAKCDAGMCKIYYHVTCAQKAGLLVNAALSLNAAASMADHTAADPYFLCCPAHSDRQTVEMKAKKFRLLQRQNSLFSKRTLTAREERVLVRRRAKFAASVQAKRAAWVPTDQKWQRLLPTSAKFFWKMGKKAEASENIALDEWQGEFRVTFTPDMVGKFVMPPAFSSDFVSYFTEREKLLPTIRNRIEELKTSANSLRTLQGDLKTAFDKADQDKRQLVDSIKEEREMLSSICSTLKSLGCQNVRFPEPSSPANSSSMEDKNRTSSKPAYTKLRENISSDRGRCMEKTNRVEPSVDSVRDRNCVECSESHDPHLMVDCDTCGKHYHMGCLNPPLTKLPKKTSLYGWQCSNCFDASSDSSDVEADVNAPRQLRATRKPVNRYATDFTIEPEYKGTLNGTISKRGLQIKRKSSLEPSVTKMRRESGCKRASEEHVKIEEVESGEWESVKGWKRKKSRPAATADMDHRSMAREENTVEVGANIEECVQAVINRARALAKKGRPKTGSVANVGLEDEKEDDETGSSEYSSSGIPAGVIRNRTSMQKRDSNVQVIRVEDLD